MRLVEASLAGFQSYGDSQRLVLEPDVTLLAGRNNVGKSAFLRALQIFREQQEGVHPEFELLMRWQVERMELLRALAAVTHISGVTEAIQSRDTHTLWIRCVPARAILTGQTVTLTGDDLHVSDIALPSLDWHARGDPGLTMGWTSGALAGSTGTDELKRFVMGWLSQAVYYAGPRRIEPGRRTVRQEQALAPDARNLTDVVAYLHSHEPRRTFPELEGFIREAFPEVQTFTVPTDPDPGSAMGEIQVFFNDRDTPTPLRLCGTGVEQMMALAVSVLTRREPTLFLIDEPQAYLHPHAERSLLRFIDRHDDHQYLIATHSHVLLNAREVHEARLVALTDGQSRVSPLSERADMFAEVGISAADIGLAEHVLWVEGPSEEGVLELLLHVTRPAQATGVRVRRMPQGPSRFASTAKKRAEAAYAFLTGLAEAIAPLPIEMTFIFDLDEKDTSERERISAASGGRALFLTVRELENLFLDSDLLTVALTQRAQSAGLDPPRRDEVERELDQLLADAADTSLFPGGCEAGQDPRVVTRGSAVLGALFTKFAASEYDKALDARLLTELALKERPIVLDPLRVIIDQRLGPAPA